MFAVPVLHLKGESKSIRSGDRCGTIVLGRSNGGRHTQNTGKDDGLVGDVSNFPQHEVFSTKRYRLCASIV